MRNVKNGYLFTNRNTKEILQNFRKKIIIDYKHSVVVVGTSGVVVGTSGVVVGTSGVEVGISGVVVGISGVVVGISGVVVGTSGVVVESSLSVVAVTTKINVGSMKKKILKRLAIIIIKK